ncbi:MAG: hypothetical protein CME01_13495 [Geminicoccus sp.]|nr:hypothetical protein [Geminicoccus sp.]
MPTSKQKPNSKLPDDYMNDLGSDRTPREEQALKASARAYKIKMSVIAVSAFALLIILSRSLESVTAENEANLDTQDRRTVSSSKLLRVPREIGELPDVDHIHIERVEADLQASRREREIPAFVGESSQQIKAKMLKRQRVVRQQLQDLNQVVSDLEANRAPSRAPNQPATIQQELQQHLKKVADDI